MLKALTEARLVRKIQPLGHGGALRVAASATTTTTWSAASCGAIADVDCAVGDTPCLTASDANGFVIDEAEVIYWGTCPDCNATVTPVETEPTGEPPTCLRARTRSSTAPSPSRRRPHTNQDWWPNQLDLTVLHAHSPAGNPLGADFDYAAEFAKLDVEALKADVKEVLTTSQDWWPADFGHYGGLFIRMSWHAAGTYRIEDGRGGAGDGGQRFAPLNSWPDNANLDKARRLLWPVKQKYGQKVSWADLLVFAGNVALEDMGFETFGFGFGREDVWEPEEVFWGPEDTWLGDERYSGERELAPKLGAVQMGLIYVNPEGPNGEPDPLKAAHDIRETFRRMAMNDEETVALIAGGHTFGKTHGAASGDYVGAGARGLPGGRPGARLEEHLRHRQGRRHHHQRPRGHLDQHADPVGQRLLRQPLRPRVGADEEPGRRQPVGGQGRRGDRPRRARPAQEAPPDDAHHRPRAARWTRRTRRSRAASTRTSTSSGWPSPRPGTSCCTATWARSRATSARWVAEPQLWQDPVPAVDDELVSDADVADLKAKVLDTGLPVDQLVRTAWASAATFRSTDKRGGANGARIRLEPQRSWAANDPAELATVLEALERSSRSSTAPAARRSRWPT